MNHLNIKQNTLLLLLISLSFSVFGQKRYISANIGYATSLSYNRILTQFVSFPNSTSQLSGIEGSLGKGISFNGAFGFMFTPNLGVELNASYLLGDKMKKQETIAGETTHYSVSANMFSLAPSLIFMAEAKNLNPYIKMGMLVTKGSITTDYTSHYDFSSGPYNASSKDIQFGGNALGVQASVGFSYKIIGNLSLFSELSYVNMSYAPTRKTLLESVTNDENQMPNLSISEKETIFVKTLSANANQNPNLPKEVVKVFYPLSSVGLHLGLKFGF
jgi:outer membrane protein W